MRISRAISHENSISYIMGYFSFSPLPFPSPLSSLPPSLLHSLTSSLCVSLSPSFSYSFSTSFSLSSLFVLSFTLSCRIQSSYGIVTGKRPLTVYSKNERLVQKSMHRSWKFLVAHQVYEPFQHIWALLDTLPISNGMGNGRNYTPAGVAGTFLSVPAGDFFTPSGKASRVFRS